MLKLPPPLWAMFLLTALYFLNEAPVFAGLPTFRHEAGGLALIAGGLALPMIAIAQFLFSRTQILPTSASNNRLVVNGLYRFTRNPMYLGVVIASLGGAVLFGRPLMYLAPVLVFMITNWVLIPYEEAKMRAQFGAEYDAYVSRVRRWI